MSNGFIISALATNSGKTTLATAIIRSLENRGINTASFKLGPDYIDPMFHRFANNKPSYNIDFWAMGKQNCLAFMNQLHETHDLLVGEGVMGLFDGRYSTGSSTADVADATNFPIVLVINCAGQGETIAEIISGVLKNTKHRVVGIIMNKYSSNQHLEILQKSCQSLNIPIIGWVPKQDIVSLKSRHLGLIQPDHYDDFYQQLDLLTTFIEKHVDIELLLRLIRFQPNNTQEKLKYSKEQIIITKLPILGQRIAIARDKAFSFIYDSILLYWYKMGVEITFFSPLANESTPSNADAVYLPGGYPELYLPLLAHNQVFISSLKAFANFEKPIYGECGGYMVLGNAITDEQSQTWPMAGLLDVHTTMSNKKLTLGYRQVTSLYANFLGTCGTNFRGHEFHYAQPIVNTSSDTNLFDVKNSKGDELGKTGLQRKNVAGSFIHLISIV